ncbi:uncharacterized protein LOC111333849 [Stylophora pistillata]|uniref:uncharacterized protein LOC111333849 n=1 Tax=Stylophora pistillata TaxID=50429 RepID=UPI000C056422|nr:uncharacterized protein LOC111333849 [Stylophora pistillata]
MNIFVREVRSKVHGMTGSTCENVFLTWNGEAMASSQINKAIKSVWKKAEMKKSPSSTLFRKSAVSKVHTTSQSNEARGNLSDLMAHNIDTARRFYLLQEKSKSSVKASKQLRSVMCGQGQQNLDKQKVSPNISSLSVSEQCASETSRTSLNKEMEDLVKSVFKDEIESEAISMEDVKSNFSDHPQLMKKGPKRILDKIRAQWRFRTPPSV